MFYLNLEVHSDNLGRCFSYLYICIHVKFNFFFKLFH